MIVPELPEIEVTLGRPARRWRLRVEWKPQDLWVGAYWDRREWWGGTMEALDASTTEFQGDADAWKHRRFDLWVCLVPMLPIHFERLRCPQPGLCRAKECWVRDVGSIDVKVAVDMGDPECPQCHGREWVHNLAMGPPHLEECSWCKTPCPTCQLKPLEVEGNREVGPESSPSGG